MPTKIELFSPTHTEINMIKHSQDYLNRLRIFLKEQKCKKNSFLISIVPATLAINNVVKTFQKSKIRNHIEIVSICSKINLNNIILNDNKQIIDDLFAFCPSGYT